LVDVHIWFARLSMSGVMSFSIKWSREQQVV
jgi:hypothetical protein